MPVALFKENSFGWEKGTTTRSANLDAETEKRHWNNSPSLLGIESSKHLATCEGNQRTQILLPWLF